MSRRRAKIVCTLGPATATPGKVRELIDAGMDVARLNLSHGTHDEHATAYDAVRRASGDAKRAVAVLVDLQGPKIRLGRFADGPVTVRAGDELTLTVDDVAGTAERVSTTYAGLPGDVAPGDRILVDDGKVALEVTAVEGTEVRTRVTEGGRLSDHKGLNLPGVAVSAPALTDKDATDLRFALRLGADLIALSFVRSPDDVEDVRAVMAAEGCMVPVLAKIEKPEAVQRLEEVVAAFDGIMVARGDLGVELPLEDVPMVQKRAITLARQHAKPVIVATQMLESMIENSRPTRAEASDVANAVLDGADALMLSGETSIGRHPVGAVAVMRRIIAAIEEQAADRLPSLPGPPDTVGGAIARAATVVGDVVGAVALVAFTESGETARRLARHRSTIPLLAFTPVPATLNQLALTWGTETFLVTAVGQTDEMIREVDAALLEGRRVQPGDLVIVVAGSPPGTPGSTNTLRVHEAGAAD